jgi:outer membrane protein TolC
MRAALTALALLALSTGGATASPAGVEELVSLALESSPLLEGARARNRAAAAQLDHQRADWRPTLDLTETWSSTDSPPAAFASLLNQGRLSPAVQADLNDPSSVSDWTTAVTLRYLLTDFGGRGARNRAAAAQLERSEHLEEFVRREVVHSVREAWQDLWAATASVATWEATLELLRVDEELTRARMEEGQALRSDLLAVSVRRGEARENLLSARHAVEIGRARLRSLIGDELPELALAADGLGRPLPPATESQVVADALGRHPQVAALEAAARAAEAGVDAARATRRPKLTASAGWDWHGDGESFGLDRDSYLVALMLHVPVYDAGRARAATAEARARRDEVLAAKREAVLGLELAARTAHRRLTESLSRIDLADAALESAREAHLIVRARHAEGLSSVTDLLESERRMTAARGRGIHARTTAWKAAAMLERIAGRNEP